MHAYSIKDKLFASIIGAYFGSLLASGVLDLIGIDWNGSTWWDWVIMSLWIAPLISLPLALLLLTTLVPYIYKRINSLALSPILKYVITGAVSGFSPIFIGYFASWIYGAFHGQFILASTLPSMSILSLHAVLVGSITLLALYFMAYNKSSNFTGADNARQVKSNVRSKRK